MMAHTLSRKWSGTSLWKRSLIEQTKILRAFFQWTGIFKRLRCIVTFVNSWPMRFETRSA